MKYLGRETIRGLGILQEVNRRFFHPLGLAAQVHEDGSLRVQDHREHPEGVIYADECMRPKEFFPLFEAFIAFEESRQAARIKALGFIVQPPPEQESPA